MFTDYFSKSNQQQKMIQILKNTYKICVNNNFLF